MKGKIELLSPAGSYASLNSAIDAGADAIYFGITHLNMRAGSAQKFSIDDLAEISQICQKAGISSYLVINTIIYDNDLTLMKKMVDAAKKNNITAIIAGDISTLDYGCSVSQEMHASTQLSISNIEAVRLYAKFTDRVVLARELDLKQIKSIVEKIKKEKITGPKGKLIEVEIFGHGAMCISVSGRCFMSGFEHNMSANRGLCRQACRRAYRIIDEETGDELKVADKYVMSPQDLCTIDFLDKISDTGIVSLKIEGRARSPEYVHITTSTYRKALDAIDDGKYSKKLVDECMEDLKTVYNRGFSKGFFFGQPVGAWSSCYGSKATTRKLFIGKVLHFFPKPSVAEILMQTGDLKIGDEIYIIGDTTGTLKQTITELRNEDQQEIKKGTKGEILTFPVEKRVRENDQIYIIEKLDENVDENARLDNRIQNY